MIVLDHFASCVLLAADPIIEWIDEIHGLRRISDDMKGAVLSSNIGFRATFGVAHSNVRLRRQPDCLASHKYLYALQVLPPDGVMFQVDQVLLRYT